MFASIELQDWKSGRDLADNLFVRGSDWGFRGHGDTSWELVTTFERTANSYGFPPDLRLDKETAMLKHFKRRAHMHLNAPPAHEDELEWLSLIQHYGGPTRLLDFSRSFYVAAFFATERAEHDAAIWAVNIHDDQSRDLDDYYKNISDHSSNPHVIRVEPSRMNQRLSIQQGFFLFPFNLAIPFIDNLAGTFGQPPHELSKMFYETMPPAGDLTAKELSVVKVVLPRSIHKEILSDLKAMNITSDSLFPGLDGFARSLYFHLTLEK